MTALLKIGDFVDFTAQEAAPQAVPLPSRWYIRRLHPLCDLRVRREAERRELSFFIPTMPVQRVICGRAHMREVPLFPGLLFVPDFAVGVRALEEIDGVGRLLHFGETPASLSDIGVRHIRMLADLLSVPRSKRRQYAVGERLEIRLGRWASWIGRFDRLDGKGRIRVLIEIMKREIAVTVTDDQVEPV